jgi:Tol biopolymer transport system component
MMAADGANPQMVVDKMGLNGLFTWMPDGKGIVHVGEDRQLHLLDLASKRERRLTNESGVMPVVAVSPDGTWVIYQCVVGRTIDLHAVPTEGAEPRIVVSSPLEDYHPAVSPSGRWLYYLPDHENLYRVPGPAQDWRSAAPEKVTDFSLTFISFIENPQLSRDGTQLAYSRGRIASDIWLMTMGK